MYIVAAEAEGITAHEVGGDYIADAGGLQDARASHAGAGGVIEFDDADIGVIACRQGGGGDGEGEGDVGSAGEVQHELAQSVGSDGYRAAREHLDNGWLLIQLVLAVCADAD